MREREREREEQRLTDAFGRQTGGVALLVAGEAVVVAEAAAVAERQALARLGFVVPRRIVALARTHHLGQIARLCAHTHTHTHDLISKT